MTNGDMIRQLTTNEQLANFILNLNVWALYSGDEDNHLLNKDSLEDLLLWVNKETDFIDRRTIFNFIK